MKGIEANDMNMEGWGMNRPYLLHDESHGRMDCEGLNSDGYIPLRIRPRRRRPWQELRCPERYSP